MNIPLNRPFLPPKEEFDRYSDEIWQRNWLTNHGPLVQQFEEEISEFLDLPDFVFVNNGTTGLLIALKALDVTGEVITTPYSYIATTSSIVWQNCQPVFADIEPKTLTIDSDKIEELITDETTAILATHVYGNPCDVESIHEIADKYSLKVIYDAAHCFGVTYEGESILKWGDATIISFHATKILHTIEGGGIYCNDDSMIQKARSMMNFGHDGPYNFKDLGINAKNSEFHAAMGLCNLSFANAILKRRKLQVEQYKKGLMGQPVEFQQIRKNTNPNFAYFPVIFETAETCTTVTEHLTMKGIETRRYFKPSLNNLPYLNNQICMPVSDDISERILCLPIFHDLTSKEITYICESVIEALKEV